MKKLTMSIISALAIIILTAPLSAMALMQKMICYKHKTDDGFIEKTRYEVIKDFCHGIRYEKIFVKE